MPKTTGEKTSATATKAACYHCGLECRDDAVVLGDKHFCCRGCLAVYRFLTESGFERYYREAEPPGVRPELKRADTRFAYLDDPDLIQRLTDSAGDCRRRFRLSVPQMHCASCIWLLEHLPRLDDGVLVSRVDFPRRELTVVLDETTTSLRRVVELLTRIGYEPQFNLSSTDIPTSPDVQRSLYLKIGVAGFCFANVMLFCFPEYLAAETVAQPALTAVFRYLSILLALPVLFYAASDYLRSAFFSLRQRRLNMDVPIALGMIVLFSRSLYEITGDHGSGYLDSLTGLVFFLLVGRLFQLKTYSHLSFECDYRSFFPVSAVRRDGNAETTVPLDRLEIGDRIIVRNRELVPADAVIVGGRASIDYSFVTGEAEPSEHGPGESVMAGGRQLGGAVELMLTRKVSQSYLVSLWSNGSLVDESRMRRTNIADRTAVWFTTVVIVIAAAAGLVWLNIDAPAATSVVTSVLIVACPCALALAGPFALGTALRLLGRDRFFLRNTQAVEALASVDTILFDKTGTLTRPTSERIEFAGDPLSQYERRLVASLARNSSHPLGRQLVRLATGGEPLEVRDFVEEPGKGMSGRVDGHLVRVGRSEWVRDDKRTADVHPAEDRRGVWVAIDLIVRGKYLLSDSYREGLAEAISSLSGDYRLMVTSGDNDRERPRLEALFGGRGSLRFEQTPFDKRDQVEELTAAGRRVLMIGDGLNDSGALKAADVGVAVAENGVGFTPAGDGIIDSSRLVSLPRYLQFVKRTVHVVGMAYALSFVYNVAGLYYAVTGQLSPFVSAILMPLSSVTVVLFAVVATRWQAKRTRV